MKTCIKGLKNQSGLDRFLVFSWFGLDRILVFSGFGLDRFSVFFRVWFRQVSQYSDNEFLMEIIFILIKAIAV